MDIIENKENMGEMRTLHSQAGCKLAQPSWKTKWIVLKNKIKKTT